MRLSTQRFVIREYREGDRDALIAYRADPRYAAQYGASEALPSRSLELLGMFSGWQRERPRRNFQLAIENKADRSLCGSVGLRDYDSRTRRAEFGLELAPSSWGRYRTAIEVGEAMLAFGFESLGLEAVFGHTAMDNGKIARLAAWFGAEPASSATDRTLVWVVSATAWRTARAARGLS